LPYSRPILVKIAPDLDRHLLAEVCDVCSRLADGMVCTNTSATPEGGLSGKPLFGRSTDVLREVRECVGPDYPLIGVGGIFDADDARAKFAAGANLIQVYTGFVYQGPRLPSRLARELAV
jgi:dihydroorotate dehydrogenase